MNMLCTRKSLALAMLLLPVFSINLFAQNNCPADAPAGYTVERSGSNCYLVFTWPANEMPQLACGTPGSPAPGSTTVKGKLIDMTLNGSTVVYANGNNCNGGPFGFVYHPTLANSYRTINSYCTIADAPSTTFVCNRTGGSNFSCTMNNFSPPLPVELTSFAAASVGDGVTLKWETASETNNSHFEIERSGDGKIFEYIGDVAGNGTTSENSFYKFHDAAPMKGHNYYRLKQVDFDGSNEFTNVLQFTNLALGDIVVVPNPVSDNSNFSIESDQAGQLQLTVFDVFGRRVLSTVFFAEKGNNQFPLETGKLASGSYSVLAELDNRQVFTTRFVKAGN